MSIKSQYEQLRSGLLFLSYSYEELVRELPDFADIEHEASDDFINAFFLMPQLIEEGFLNKKSVVAIIRCYLEVQITPCECEENETLDFFINSDYWNNIRSLAKEALFIIDNQEIKEW